MPPLPHRVPVELPGGRSLAVALRPGSGRPIVLLHGMTDSADSFRLILPFLGGRALVVPDLRGHGGSPGGGDMAVAAMAADVVALLDVLGLPDATLVGHSLGALTALRLAADHPRRVDRLVLLAGALAVSMPVLDWMAATVATLPDPLPSGHAFFRDWHRCEGPVPPEFLRLLARQTAGMQRRDWLAIIAGLHEVDLNAAARELTRPVLAISGAADPLFPAEDHTALTAAFKHGQGLLLPGAGHNPHWDRPEDVARHILDFASAPV